jgi:hypothetical protein
MVNYNRRTPHQSGTKAFKDLTFKEQALSINGSIANLEKAMRYHARIGAEHTANGERAILEKCLGQIERLATRLRR